MTIRLKFEPRDVWVGVYFDPAARRCYICLLPMLPIVISLKAGGAI